MNTDELTPTGQLGRYALKVPLNAGFTIVYVWPVFNAINIWEIRPRNAMNCGNFRGTLEEIKTKVKEGMGEG